MLRRVTKLVLVVALGCVPVLFSPQHSYAQTSAEERAYQAGYQNGVNDRNRNKPLNLKTDNWHGQNLSAYQWGYKDGYNHRGNGRYPGYGGNPTSYKENSGYGQMYQTDAERRAYQAGFQNGQNDRQKNKQMNLKTDNWKGQNLTAYQKGYQDGYRGPYRH